MKLVMLDRDGVLNEDRPEGVLRPDNLVMLPRAAEAVGRLNAAGVKVAVVTNQSSVGRGAIDEAMLERINARLHLALAAAGAHLDALLFAPDAPGAATERRKPGPGMLREALAAFDAVPGDSPMIGDALRDLEAAAAAGCPRVLVRTGKGASTEAEGLPEAVQPVAVYGDLWDAVDHLLEAGGWP